MVSIDRATNGINVIGHVGANLGVGVVTRQVIALIERQGRPVAVFDVDLDTQRERPNREYDRLSRKVAAELPHRINLFVLGLGALDWTLSKCPDHFFDGSYLNAILCFWELPVLSPARSAHLDRMDVVIGASDFLRHVFQEALREATVLGGFVPVVLPTPVPFDRQTIGIADDATAFVYSFDPASDADRKNPGGVVRAFVEGVGQMEDAYLVVKINNARDRSGTLHASVATLEAQAGSHPRIVFVTESMSYAQVIGLYQACDVYVSLHRAEGLGLGMAEAMMLGRPVIATGWSGNMTFMRQTTACLVGYRMIPVHATTAVYREHGVGGIATWADPDLHQAAAFMAYLHSDRAARRSIGEAAATAMAEINAAASRALFLDELEVLFKQRKALASVGFAVVRRSGRPELRIPSPPLAARLAETCTHTAGRIRRKAGKIVRQLLQRTDTPTSTRK